jgi:predicted ribosomally synthesized peptide with SipW-like signal peptide
MLKRFSSKKILLSVAALGTAGAMAGLGTFATFTSTTNSSNTATDGRVHIALGATGAANRFSESSSTLVAGDSVHRVVDLINTSTDGDLGQVTLTTTTSNGTSLTSDTTNGLHMQFSRCDLALGWTEAGAANHRTYTCPSGNITEVLANTPVIGSAAALGNLTVEGGLRDGVDHLLLTLTLPSTADNTFQELTSTVLYTFDATQRDALATR